MTQRNSLMALAAVSTALTAALCVAALGSVRTLAEAPLSLWGGSQLTSAVVALASGAGAGGALWHAASAVVALAATGRRGRPASDVASRLLQRWGAPLVRRVAVGAVVAGLSTAPALAAEPDPPLNDLGWRPTSSASKEVPASTAPEPGPAEPTDPGPQEVVSIPPEQPEATEPPGPTPRTSHTVTPGESLWSVTALSLPAGSSTEDVSAAWPALYEANREVVGPDPTVIRPGTTLTLPEWTVTTQAPQEEPDTRPSSP